MKTALLTGATGFVGQNVLPVLQQEYEVFSPRRSELDLRSAESVRSYFQQHKIDIVFHCANPNPVKNSADNADKMMEDSMRIFLNLYACRDLYEKMIYLGSGAEYDKQQEIAAIREEDCFRSIPKDAYGFAKYVINQLASQSSNVYNLCLFACFGPGDHESKFITHCIRSCMAGKDITIRQDCRFDYIQVTDLGRMMAWMGNHDLKHHMYNVSGCSHAMLSEIAREVRRQMDADVAITVLTEGLNREYTADGSRFWEESGIAPPMSLAEGIAIQIKWEKENFK